MSLIWRVAVGLVWLTLYLILHLAGLKRRCQKAGLQLTMKYTVGFGGLCRRLAGLPQRQWMSSCVQTWYTKNGHNWTLIPVTKQIHSRSSQRLKVSSCVQTWYTKNGHNWTPPQLHERPHQQSPNSAHNYKTSWGTYMLSYSWSKPCVELILINTGPTGINYPY
jgi:hypothetical protein